MAKLLRETFPVGMLRCNCTILADLDAGEALVVDPGDDLARILSFLATHQLKLTGIYVTHAHIDHVGAAAKLRAATGAPVSMNQNDLPLLQMMDTQAAWLGVPAPTVIAPDMDAVAGLKVSAGRWTGHVLATPGHTQGSTCLHFPEQNLLLSGDTLFAGSIGRTDLPGGDSAAILRSIRDTLFPLPDDTTVVPGHGEETVIGMEKQHNPFLHGL